MEDLNFLIISQDKELKKSLQQELSQKEYNLIFLDNFKDIHDTIKKHGIDVLIIDQHIKNTGEIWELFDKIQKSYPLKINILLSSSDFGDKDIICQLNKGVLKKFIPRSFPASKIKEEIEHCLLYIYPVKSIQSKIELLESRLKKLNEIGISLSSEHNLSVLLYKILREARKITGSEAGSLYIVKDDKLSFEVAQNDFIDRRDGPHQETFQSIILPLSTQSIAGYVALTGETLNIEDAYKIPRECPYSFNIEVDKKTGYRCKSMLVVPMKNEKDEIIGVLQLINSLDPKGEITTYGNEDERVVLSLASQAAVAICNAFLIIEIKKLLSSLVEYSSSMIDARSQHTAGHSQRVAAYTMEIARAINRQKDGSFALVHFSPDEIEELRFSAFLHDIGKIGIPERILDKRNKLTDEHIELIRQRFEFIKSLYQNSFLKDKDDPALSPIMKITSQEELQKKMEELDADFEFIKKMNIPSSYSPQESEKLRQVAEKEYIDLHGKKRKFLTPFESKNLSILQGNLTDKERKEIQYHINHTINILSKIPFPKDLCNVPFFAGSHHERLNGCGYPKGLKSKELPLQSRILSLVDFYEALTAPDRPYRSPLPREKALEILKEEASMNRCDKDLVDLIEKANLLKV